MEQKVIWSRWVNGVHKATERQSVKAALMDAIQSSRNGESGQSQIVIGHSCEEVASARVVMTNDQIAEADWAHGGAHPPRWRNREVKCARRWQQICSAVKGMEINHG